MYYNLHNLTPDQINDVQNQLSQNEDWKKVPAEYQAELLSSLWKNFGDELLDSTVEKVLPPKKKRVRKQKVEKKVGVKPKVEKKEDEKKDE